VVDPFSQYESEPIRGSNGEESRIQEEHRQNDSTTRESSRTGSVWGTNNGHENVSNSKGERTRENNKRLWERSSRIIGGERTSGSKNVENSRRTLQQGTELSKKNENETREGNADIDQRSSGTSRSNVADTESIDSNVGERGEHQEERQGQQQTRGKSGETMVDSSTGRCTPQETEVQPGRYSSFDSSWWQSEPELGRVAHGVQGRVHRLKALGNSIVPKIVQEIGNAIIEAEKEKDLEILDQRNGF